MPTQSGCVLVSELDVHVELIVVMKRMDFLYNGKAMHCEIYEICRCGVEEHNGMLVKQ